MGNTNTNSKHRNERPYSIDVYNNHATLERRCDSPRNDDMKAFDFGTGGGGGGGGGNASTKRRPVLCYQSSTDYGGEDPIIDFKVPSSQEVIDLTAEQKMPTVFKWEGGGKDVYITGDFSQWKPLKMVESQGDFVTVVDIPEGTHKYKFVVDGIEVVDKACQLDENRDNNVINVKKSDFEVFEALAMDLATNQQCNNNNNNNNNKSVSTALSGSPPGSYSQDIPVHDTNTTSSGPPVLPPHLLQVILNQTTTFVEPILLPQPNHVMLNHLYALSIKDGVMVLSTIHRYRKKFVTTLLYKPILGVETKRET